MNFISKNITSPSAYGTNLVRLENSVNRLVLTLCMYNGVRLLLHFCLMHNSMICALTGTRSPSTDHIKSTADQVR